MGYYWSPGLRKGSSGRLTVMRLAWMTDPHFNFLPPFGARGRYVAQETGCDAVVLTGDIAESKSLEQASRGFAEGLDKPVYFVLGNHDYYSGSTEGTRTVARRLDGNLRWLDSAGVVQLSKETALVGHEGWYDAQYGDPMGSRVWMSDFDLIEDLRGLTRQDTCNQTPLSGTTGCSRSAYGSCRGTGSVSQDRDGDTLSFLP